MDQDTSVIIGTLIGSLTTYLAIKSEKEALKSTLILEMTSNRLTYLRMMRDVDKKEIIKTFEKVLGSDMQHPMGPYNVWATDDWKKTFSDQVETYKKEFPDHNLDKQK
jgi:hypothetical protein